MHPGRFSSQHRDQQLAKQRAEFAKQTVTVRCAHCTGPGKRGRAGRPFQFTGPIIEARQRFADHRARAHPELPTLDEVKTRQRRTHRVAVTRSKGTLGQLHLGWGHRREFQTAEELATREQLRRMVRTDLPPVEAA